MFDLTVKGGDSMSEHKHHHDEHSCSCGHEHHHDEHSCGCSHEHHHHEHSCGCGHEHHHHEHSCGCGHEHHHHEHENKESQHTEIPSEYRKKAQSFLLENLSCAHCAAQMEEKIQKLPGVQFADITYTTKQLRIVADNTEALIPRITEICTSIEPDIRICSRDTRSVAAQKENKTFWQAHGELTVLITGAVLFLAGEILPHIFTGLPDWTAFILFLIAYLLLGSDVLATAGKNLIKGRIFDENFLMSIATIGAFIIGEYGEAAGVMLFYCIGEFFEEKAVEKSRAQIMDAVDMRPETVLLIGSDGAAKEIPAEDARPGDLVLVRPGDRIPLDGRIVNGSGQLDTSAITGEPVPVGIRPGDNVSSGSVNLNGTLTLLVEKPLEDSLVSRILDAVENAAASKPRMDRFITRFSRYYTPAVLAAALATAIIPSLATGNWSHWVYTALTFLVISCPCALVLSVPLAFFSGIGAGSKLGILFKGGASLEMLKDVRAVIMDKTGTITKGNFVVQQLLPLEGSADELLALTAACEQNSTHPIAVSIVNEARQKNLNLASPDETEEIAGHGVRAVFGNDTVLCGNRKLMEHFHVKIPVSAQNTYGCEVLIARNGSLIGSVEISDTIKPDAKDAVGQLKTLGITPVMLTGDSSDNAKEVADRVGIEKVYARLLPHEKLSRLQELRKEYGSVMFVGDGINDAPVLAGADVGAAMGSGADAAIEAADVVFMTASMDAVPRALAISRRTNAIAVQNVVFALAVKICVMLLGLAGFASMWLAVFADSGVAMLCVLNAIRVLYTSSSAKK